jgi:protein tyrosine phosphatase (PTP) superfamily phosphohydrolase (DUF442 family)
MPNTHTSSAPTPNVLADIYHYEQVTDWLGTSGQPTRDQFSAIADAGYGAVINLAPPTADRAIADEGSIVATLGMVYVNVPVDFKNPTPENLKTFFGVMNALDGQKIWVHCVVNARVSAFVYQYLRTVKGFSDAAASTDLLARWLPEMDDVWTAFLAIEAQTLE